MEHIVDDEFEHTLTSGGLFLLPVQPITIMLMAHVPARSLAFTAFYFTTVVTRVRLAPSFLSLTSEEFLNRAIQQ
jgi:hypothetical protein